MLFMVDVNWSSKFSSENKSIKKQEKHQNLMSSVALDTRYGVKVHLKNILRRK